MVWVACLVVCLGIAGLPPAQAQEAAKVGDTRVARWKDDRTAVFLLMFDDGWPSHFQVVIPELAARGMIATFYICPDKGEYKKFEKQWAELVAAHGMVLADHTMTHRGVKDADNARYEILDCAKIIRQIQPGKEGRLVSYGQPGVPQGAWNITGEQLNALLAEGNLISRPTFDGHGANYHVKTLEDMLAMADKAIAAKGMDYLVFHGVERLTPNWGYQDMWAVKQDVFFPFLDGLKERRDRGDLWITDHISQHQYEKERESAEVKVLEASDNLIKVELSSSADPALYDYPLTLVAKVPASWKGAEITQAGKTAHVTVDKETAKFDAIPNAGTVEIRPDKAPVAANTAVKP